MFITKKSITLILALSMLFANFLFSNSLSLESNGDGTWNVNYSSDAAIGGYQFNVGGASITDASGGASADAGFMISASSSTVLGFSLSGATLPSGDGLLVVVTLDGEPTALTGIVVSDNTGSSLGFVCAGNYCPNTCDDMNACNYGEEADCVYAEENYDCDGNCTVEIDCAGECGGNAVVDECGECGGSGADYQCWDGSLECEVSDCPEEPADLIELSFTAVNTADGILDIYMTNTGPVAGFQVELSGLNITGASGGSATDAGFMISTGCLLYTSPSPRDS